MNITKIQYNMTQEEKAKAYDEAIERARYWAKCPTVWNSDDICQKIFPELVESEENRIKRCIGMALTDVSEQRFTDYDTSLRDCLAWLEKQGEQKVPVNDFKAKDWYYSKVDGKIHNIYHSVDKVEPKFKVGDLITDGYVGGQITSIEENYPCYKITDFMGGINSTIPFTVQDNYHLWTIEDAKDGDVLCVKYGNDEMPFIFTGKRDNVAYCALNSFGEFVLSIAGWLLKTSVLPATKEQRELLFQKMKEAGYEWDAEKKELKKIENKRPLLSDFFNSEYERGKADAIKESSWSEDDEEIICTVQNIICSTPHVETFDEKCKLMDWFKSLKDRYTWKPNDEQIDALEEAMYQVGILTPLGSKINDLYEQLKKLKGE